MLGEVEATRECGDSVLAGKAFPCAISPEISRCRATSERDGTVAGDLEPLRLSIPCLGDVRRRFGAMTVSSSFAAGLNLPPIIVSVVSDVKRRSADMLFMAKTDVNMQDTQDILS